MRRPFLYLSIAAVLATFAVFVPEQAPEVRLQREADRLQRVVIDANADLEALCDEAPRRIGPDSTQGWRAMEPLRDSLARTGSELLLRWYGTRYWTSSLPLDERVLDTLVTAHLRSGSSVYLLSGALSKQGSVHALRLLWYQPPFENRYLRNRFHPSLGVADGVAASIEPGLGPVVRDELGKVLFRLLWADDTPPPSDSAIARLFCTLACSGLLMAALWAWLSAWAEGGRTWAATLGLILLVGAFRWAALVTAPWPAFDGFGLFTPDLLFASTALPSLGDLLITVALLVFITAFARHTLQPTPGPAHPAIAATAGMLVLMAFAGWINNVLISLVRDSRIPLDLFHAQSLDATSAIALLAIAFLLFAWVMLADALTRWIAPGINKTTLGLITVLVFASTHVVYHLLDVYDSVLVLWPLPLLLSLVLMRRRQARFGILPIGQAGALLMIVSLSMLTVHILNRQTFKRIERDRQALAESAGTREDPLIEWLFSEARAAMGEDAEARALMQDTAAIAAAELDTRVRQRFFQGTWNNYDVRLHLFGPQGRLRGTTSREAPPTLNELRARFEQGVPVEGDHTLRNVHRPMEHALYIGALGDMDTSGRARLIVELLPRVLPEGLGFPELLMAGDRAVDRRTDRYARARYERGVLVETSGAFAFPTRWSAGIASEGSLTEMNGFALFATGDAATTAVIIGSQLPTWLDHVTTFSYLFLFYALLATAFLVLRSLIPWNGRPPFGVGGKLRTGILLFAGTAIVLFAFGAQRLLRTDHAAHVTEQLDERSRSAVAELRQHTRLEATIRPDMRRDLDHWIDKASAVLLTDIAAYAPSGELIGTSREQVFNSGLLGTRMDPDAYMAMAIGNQSAFTHEERIGDAAFQAAYRPLLNDRGDVLAYISVPYFARQSEIDDERTAGYVAIVNLFVLLFLLSTLAAAVIANWTTRPLLLLKRGLERIQLGERNDPLPYQGDDELGELVRVYNRKVEELRESAEKLARSERESAWKEMAKQVAHEIKNPLTPMKLGIQHFQHTWDASAPNAKEKLDRFTTSMVEQIDALSRVAGDFSRFAQMSAAHEVVLDLNEVAKNAVALFAGTPNADISLHATTPLMVKADREHLLRVFNNLIKNALQAVPEERRGKVDVMLREEGDQAIVEVRDNGSGIPEGVRDRIFEPSFTTKSSGMGLGLAMVRRMVEQAGGHVRFDTSVGTGTTFVISLPLTTLQ